MLMVCWGVVDSSDTVKGVLRMKRILPLVALCMFFCAAQARLEAVTAIYKYQAISEKSGIEKFRATLPVMERELAARYLFLHFEKNLVGITGRIFVDVDPTAVNGSWRKNLEFVDALKLTVTVYTWFDGGTGAPETYANPNRKHTVTETFSPAMSAFGFLERWKIFTPDFPILSWNKAYRVQLGAGYKVDTKYTAELMGVDHGREWSIFKETLKLGR